MQFSAAWEMHAKLHVKLTDIEKSAEKLNTDPVNTVSHDWGQYSLAEIAQVIYSL
jgi:hypothetical protein